MDQRGGRINDDSARVHVANRFDNVEHFAAHRAGVHAERAADAAGNAFEEFQAGDFVATGFDGDVFETGAGAAAQLAVDPFDAAGKRMRETDDDAANAAVADKKI